MLVIISNKSLAYLVILFKTQNNVNGYEAGFRGIDTEQKSSSILIALFPIGTLVYKDILYTVS